MRRSRVIDTPTPGEFIAVFIDDDGLPMNVTISDLGLNSELSVSQAAVTAAVDGALTEEDEAVTVAVDDQAAVHDRVFCRAEEILAERAAAQRPIPAPADPSATDAEPRVARQAKPKPPAKPVQMKKQRRRPS